MTTKRRTVAGLLLSMIVTVLAQNVAAGVTPTYLDASFGAAGVFQVDTSPARSRASAVTVQADGRIVIAGSRNHVGGGIDAMVVRLLPNGQPDTSFGTSGVVVLDSGGAQTWIMHVVLQPDGKILLSASVHFTTPRSYTQMQLIRLDASGNLDASFQGGRVVATMLGENINRRYAALALQPDGKILLADDVVRWEGSTMNLDMAVVRFHADGTPDIAFGKAGVAVADFSATGQPRDDVAAAVVVLSSGAIVIGGPSRSYDEIADDGFALARFTPDGAPDVTFGADGRVRTLFSPRHSHLNALVALPGGRFVAAGQVSTYGRLTRQRSFALVQYSAAGVLDPSFGTGGLAVIDVQPEGGYDTKALSLVRDAAGRLVVGGPRDATSSPQHEDFAVARLLPSGVPDPSFGGSGRVVTRLGGPFDILFAIAVQPDGRVLGAGLSGGRFTAVRYRATSGVSAAGWNPVGELGTGTAADAHAPAPAPALYGADVVSAGAYHGLAAKGDGTVWGWGWNGVGQLGDGTTLDRWSPVPIAALHGVTAVGAGAYHSLAVEGDDGSVWAWGWNALGQVGDGTTADRHDPVAVPLSGVAGVSAGALHSLAVKADGTVWAWGWNGAGQLGDGTTTDRLVPEQVPGLTGVVAVTAGAYHSVALKADGSVWAWGWNVAGQLGDGTTTDRHAPVQVTGLSRVKAVAAGAFHSLAVAGDGSVRAWGWNVLGQLGDGTTTDRHQAVPVAGLTGVASVSGGALHSLAVKADGSAWSWGWNGVGQLGTGTTSDSATPLLIGGVPGVTSVAAGLAQSFVLTP